MVDDPNRDHPTFEIAMRGNVLIFPCSSNGFVHVPPPTESSIDKNSKRRNKDMYV